MWPSPAAEGLPAPQTRPSPPVSEPISSIPIKRILDDDVQFVSEKPVKKRRASDGAVHVTGCPAQPLSGLLNAGNNSPGNATPLAENADSQDMPRNPSVTQPEGTTGLEPRTTSSLPAMEKFTFSQSRSPTTASETVQKSPVLSPKQLPRTIAPALLKSLPHPPPFFSPFSFTELLEQPLYPGMDAGFDFMNVLPQHMSMTSEAATGQRAVNPPADVMSTVQMPDVNMADQSANLMALAQAAERSAPMETSPQAVQSAHIESPGKPRAPLEPGPSEHREASKERDLPQGANVPGEKRPELGAREIASPKLQPPRPPQAHLPQPFPPRHMGPPLRPPCLECAVKWRQQQACMAGPHGIAGMGPMPPPPPGHGFGPGHSPCPPRPGLVPPMPSGAGSGMHNRYVNGHNMGPFMGPPMHHGPRPPHAAFTPTGPGQPGHLGYPGQMHAGAPSSNQPPSGSTNDTASKKPPNPAPRQNVTPAAQPTKKAAVVTAAESRLGTSAEARKTPSPNLYVDIAETCLEIFPYAEVARRHAVSRQRVVDVFTAVIQLPLLRCPTDKRRVGKLGVTRMKEYNKAKKDLQAEKNAAMAAAAAKKAEGGQQQREGGGGPEAQEKETPTAPPPSIFEVAQFMGPLEVPEITKQKAPAT